MRNLFILTLLVAVVVFGSLAADAASMSTAGPGNPADVSETPFHTVIPSGSVGTPTMTLAGTATVIGTVPAGATAVFIVASGAVNVGNASVTTGINGGIPVTSGAYLKLNLRRDDLTPAVYLINQGAGAVSTVTATLWYVK